MKIIDLNGWQRVHHHQNATREWFVDKCKNKFFVLLLFRITEEKTGALGEKDRILQEKEAELKRMQEMLAAMQAQMQQNQ